MVLPARSSKPALLFALALFAGAWALAAGCGMGSENVGPSPGGNGPNDSGAGGEAPGYETDGGPSTGMDAAAPSQHGSPLCHALWTTSGCYPDDNHVSCSPDAGTLFARAPEPNAAGEAKDGSVYSPDPSACRVRNDGKQTQDVCMAASTGQDGAGCSTGTDCATGYECVTVSPIDGVNGKPGQCRHYCCDGPSVCQNGQFCDVQATVDTPRLPVPACMPVQDCHLLRVPSDCRPSESCTIVTDDGITSCVSTGTRQIGDECETAHCADGLVCLGETGWRTCYQLCEKTGDFNQCPTGEKCKGSAPRFKDPNIGYCTRL